MTDISKQAGRAFRKHPPPVFETESEELVACPTCKGSGTNKVTMSTWGSSKPESVSYLKCRDCQGQCTVTQERATYLKDRWARWCRLEL